MVTSHTLFTCALSAAPHVREIMLAFARWQRIVVAIWAINPIVTFCRVRR